MNRKLTKTSCDHAYSKDKRSFCLPSSATIPISFYKRGVSITKGLSISSLLLSIVMIVPLVSCTPKETVKKPDDSLKAQVSSSSEIKSIEVTGDAIVVTADSPFEYTIYKPEDPFRITVDMRGVTPGTLSGKVDTSGSSTVSEIKVQHIKTPVEGTRLDVLLSSPAEVVPEYNNGVLTLRVRETGSGESSGKTGDVAEVSAELPKEENTGPEVSESGDKLPPAQYIEAVSMERLADSLLVTIRGDGRMIPDVFPLDNRLVIDIPGVDMKAELPGRVIKPLKGIRWGEHEDMLRIVLDLDDHTTFDVVSVGEDIQIRLRSAGLVKETTLFGKKAEGAGAVPPAGETPGGAAHTGKVPVIPADKLKAGAYTGKRISLDFQDADIVPIFRLFADVSGYNIVIDPQVRGKITMKLINVPWDQALDLILKSNKLDKVVEGNIIRIAPLSVLSKEKEAIAKQRAAQRKAEPLVTKVYPISYAKVKNVKAAIDQAKILSNRGNISADERISSIIVKDVESNMPKVEALVKTLDKPTPQVLIEARIVEVNTASKSEFGIKWGLTSHSYDKTVSLGGLGLTPYMVDFPSGAGAGSGSGLSFGFINPAGTLKLDLEIGALENAGRLKIISNPRIITVDNEEAFISQGKSIPVRKLTAQGTISTEFKDIKLELRVKPHITPDGSVILMIEAKKEDIDPTLPSIEGVPGTDKKEAKTNVIVKDGETIVIGGIYKTFDNNSDTGVPGAKDIPVLGWLFKKRQKEFNTNELLIFVTPRIIRRAPGK
ncbi:MAG TPA: type IV pilus secretin family protein [Nitrospirae bacterium]|nr:type IV pilus secretin family protein [Nitrospirota bacterium]